MADFDHSPRSSKRQRTGTYATRRTTLTATQTQSAADNESAPALAHDGMVEGEQLNMSEGEPRGRISPSMSSGGRDISIPNHVTEGADASDVGTRKRKQVDNETAHSAQGGNGRDDTLQEKTKDKTPRGSQDTTEVQTRSSGRARRLPKRYTVEQEPSGDSTKPHHEKISQKTIRNAPPIRQQSIQSPQPKGILTPSRRERRQGPRKSVVFDGDEKRIEQQLGFKDIDSSSKKKDKRASKASPIGAPKVADDADVELEHPRLSTPLDGEESEVESLLDRAPDVAELLSQPTDLSSTIEAGAFASSKDDNEHVTKIKLEILNRLTASSLSPISHLQKEYNSLHSLLTATITAGESNSLLLLGSRGSGKTAMVEHALQDMMRKHHDDFNIVRLDGFFQTDDKLALREIWRQLGREMAVSEDETGEVSSYADTMASLLTLLSHPEEVDAVDAMAVDGLDRAAEKTAKSVVFVLDEFDLFTTHPRQTLLYNLFDIAQAKKAPIAVVGCSTRMDVVDLLEKRVKSRFSHRWLHVAAVKSLAAYEEALCETLCLPLEGAGAVGLPSGDLEWRERWNRFIKTRFIPSTSVNSIIKKTFYSTKSISDVLAALYIPVATIDLDEEGDRGREDVDAGRVSPSTQPSLLALIPQLPTLHLALLIAGARLETIHNLVTVNFSLVHSHYSELLARAKLQRAAYSSLASGGAFTGAGLRSWSKETARGAWEDLAAWQVIVPVAGFGGNSGAASKLNDEGLGGDGGSQRMFRLDVTLDETAWAIKEKLGTVGAAEILARWCKEV